MIEIDTDHPVTLDAVVVWGGRNQLEILQEECGEVITALARFKRGRISEDEVAEEIADVIVSAMSVIPVLKIEDLVKIYISQKISRLQWRNSEERNRLASPGTTDITPIDLLLGPK